MIVGVSKGIEKIFNILEEKLKNDSILRAVSTDVWVVEIGKNLTEERFKIVNELWKNGINAEILYQENPRQDKQMEYAINNKISHIIEFEKLDEEIKNWRKANEISHKKD